MRVKLMVFLAMLTVCAMIFIAPANATNTGQIVNFFKQLKHKARANGSSLDYGSIRDSGVDSVIIYNLAIRTKKNRIQIRSLLLENAKMIGKQGFRFDNLLASKVRIVGNGKKNWPAEILIREFTVRDFLFPDFGNHQVDQWPFNIKSAEFKDTRLNARTNEHSNFAKIPKISIEGLTHSGKRNFSLQAFDLGAIDGEFKDEKFNGKFNFDGLKANNASHFGTYGFQLGNFKLGKFYLDGIDESEGTPRNIKINFDGMRLENFYSPDYANENFSLIPENDLISEVGTLEVLVNNKPVMGLDRMYGQNIVNADTRVMDGSGTIEGLFVDFASFPLKEKDKRNLQQLFEMGYEKLILNMNIKAFWDMKSGVIDISQYRIEIEDALAIDMALRVAGYTEALAKKLSQLSNKMNQETDKDKTQAMSLQILSEMAALIFEKFELKIEDQSFLNKVLELQSSKLKQDPEQIAGMVSPMASIMLAPYNIPEFAASLSKALGVFMQGDKTITISLDPDTPVPITEIIGLSAGVKTGNVQPVQLIERFNVTVESE